MVTGEVYHRIWFDWEGIKKTQNCCELFIQLLDAGLIGIIQMKFLCFLKERWVGCDQLPSDEYPFTFCPGCRAEFDLQEIIPEPPPPEEVKFPITSDWDDGKRTIST